MKFSTTCFLSVGKSATLQCPNLTKKCKIPIKIVLTEVDSDGNETPASAIICKLSTGGTEIGHLNEPSFRLTNEIDLSSYKGVIDRNGTVTVNLTNRSTDPKNLMMHTEYVESFGGILSEEKIDHFETLLTDIKTKGFCTRLVITANRQLESLEFAGKAECDDHESWVQPLNVPIDTELDVDDQVYNIEFAAAELGPLYSENLEFLELRAKAVKTEADTGTFYLYVLAYGFPHKR
jgi:hypothetical protein